MPTAIAGVGLLPPSVLFFRMISQKTMQLGSLNLTFSTMSPGNPFILVSKGQRARNHKKKTFNNVGLYTVVLVSYIYRPACDCTVTVHWLFWIWPTPFQQPGVSAQRVLLIISAIALHGKKRRVLEFCVTVDPVIRTAGICYSGLVG